MKNPQLVQKIEHAIQVLFGFRQHNQYLSVSNAEGDHLINIAGLVYCSMDITLTRQGKKLSHLTFHLTDGRNIPVTKTLSIYEKQLAPYLFIKISAKCLVNLMHINSIKKEEGKVVLNSISQHALRDQAIELSISKNRLEIVYTLFHALKASSKVSVK